MVEMSFSGFLLCSLACSWVIFWCGDFGFFPISFLMELHAEGCSKGNRTHVFFQHFLHPGDVHESVPAPTSFRGISESFRSQVLPMVSQQGGSQGWTGWSQGENVCSCCFLYVVFIHYNHAVSKCLFLTLVLLSALSNPNPRFQTSHGYAVQEVQIWFWGWFCLWVVSCAKKGKKGHS